MQNKYKPLLAVIITAVVLYAINKLLFLLPDLAYYYAGYHYSLEVLYLFFTVLSLLVMFALIVVSEKLPDSAGYAFISATTVKMGICYFVISPILDSQVEGVKFQKANFLLIFIVFLAVEAYYTARLLNKKQ